MSNNTRIRYSKVRPGVLQSRRHYTTGAGQEVSVELDLTNKKYRIIDSVSSAEVTSGGKTTNVAVLKIQSKKALMALGVDFAAETRDRANTQPNEAPAVG